MDAVSLYGIIERRNERRENEREREREIGGERRREIEKTTCEYKNIESKRKINKRFERAHLK